MSAEQGRRLMLLRGVTPNGHLLWGEDEVRPLVTMHPDCKAVFASLKTRSKPAIYSKAARLGITIPCRPWSDNEILRLRIFRTGTRSEVLAAFPSRTWGAISCAARLRGHSRPRQAAKSTGLKIIDQIHERARSMGLTLKDLDGIAKHEGFFSARKWKGNTNYAIISRVIVELGGTMRASFGSPASRGGNS